MTSKPIKREREPLTIKSAHLNMIEAFQNGLKGMAMALGDDTEVRLKNQAYEQKGMHVPTERSLLMQEFTGRTDFAEAVAHQSGGVFVQMPTDDLVDGDIQELFMECTKELGKLVAEFQAATDDGVVDALELKRLEAIKTRLCTKAASIIQMTEKVFCDQTAGESHG